MQVRPRSLEKRARILAAAMRHFAEHGYEAARVEDLAAGLRIAKGSVFQHFGSKEGLFLAAYRKAVELPARAISTPPRRCGPAASSPPCATGWSAPSTCCARTGSLSAHPHRQLRQRPRACAARSTATWRREDPYGTMAFVREGSSRGELRSDVDLDLMASILDWTVERFQDALLAEELFPGSSGVPGSRPHAPADRGVRAGAEGRDRSAAVGCRPPRRSAQTGGQDPPSAAPLNGWIAGPDAAFGEPSSGSAWGRGRACSRRRPRMRSVVSSSRAALALFPRALLRASRIRSFS